LLGSSTGIAYALTGLSVDVPTGADLNVGTVKV